MHATRLSMPNPDLSPTRDPVTAAARECLPPIRLGRNHPVWTWLLLAALVVPALALARGGQPARPMADTLGITPARLSADYWIHRQPAPDTPILDSSAIQAQNARLLALDKTVYDLEKLSATLTQDQVHAWVSALSRPPTRTLYNERGQPVDAATLSALQAAVQTDAMPTQATPRHGLVVRRADLRTFPTRQRVFSAPGDTDIDRFQESALFPGTPVLMVHESADGQWWFVVSPTYAAWVEKQHVAEGKAQEVFAYARKTPFVVVTGATVRTTFTPEQPAVSDLQLDMGVRLPLLADWPQDQAVNGQHPYTSQVVQLPIRDAQGQLKLVPALLPKTADVAHDVLPLTQANLLRQSFKFLGERYGWGHSYGTRDCSGFVSEIYRSMGVALPRNTSAQAVSPALNRIAFDKNTPREQRLAALRDVHVGDLVYIPGLVMMVIGKDNGQTWLIHDTHGITYRNDNDQPVRAPLNGVSVTPLEPLLYDGNNSFIDHITNLQRIRP